MIVKLHVSEVRQGDAFVGDVPDDVSSIVFWTAIADAEVHDGRVDVHVRLPDGGSVWRVWDEDIELTFKRAS